MEEGVATDLSTFFLVHILVEKKTSAGGRVKKKLKIRTDK